MMISTKEVVAEIVFRRTNHGVENADSASRRLDLRGLKISRSTVS
jgi:hypothetical protein